MTEPPIADQELLKVYRNALAQYGGNDKVTGVDIGYKYVDGHRTEDIGVRVHSVDGSLWLDKANASPPTILDKDVSEIAATYRLHGCAEASADLRRNVKVEPIRPGISVSGVGKKAGTLGLIVEEASGSMGVLSNSHVLINTAAGKTSSAIQPGTGMPGSSPKGDVIGTGGEKIFDFDGDAAFIRLNGWRDVCPEQVETRVIVREARLPRIGETLVKSGSSTGVTSGRVDGFGRYFLREAGGDKVVLSMDGFKIVPVVDKNPDGKKISDFGDSGSLWYGHDDHKGIGLHVAGDAGLDPAQEHAIVCYLPAVLARLGLKPAVTSYDAPLMKWIWGKLMGIF
jgi:endonuclease G